MTIFGDDTPVWLQNVFGMAGLIFLILIVGIVIISLGGWLAERRNVRERKQREVEETQIRLDTFQRIFRRLENGEIPTDQFVRQMRNYENSWDSRR